MDDCRAPRPRRRRRGTPRRRASAAARCALAADAEGRRGEEPPPRAAPQPPKASGVKKDDCRALCPRRRRRGAPRGIASSARLFIATDGEERRGRAMEARWRPRYGWRETPKKSNNGAPAPPPRTARGTDERQPRLAGPSPPRARHALATDGECRRRKDDCRAPRAGTPPPEARGVK